MSATPLQEAVQLHQSGQISEALARYQELLTARPDDPDLNHLAGLALHQIGQNNEALPLLSRACEFREQNGQFRTHWAMALGQSGRGQEAIEQFERGVELAPESTESYIHYGAFLARCGQVRAGVDQFRAALEMDPNCLDAHVNLCKYLRDLRQHDAAKVHGKRAIALAPEHALAHTNLGNVYSDTGHLNLAREHFRAAIKAQPTHFQAWSNLAHSHRYQPEQEADRHEIQSMRDLTTSAAQFPPAERSHLYYALGKAHADLGDQDEAAFDYYRQANELALRPFPFDKFEAYCAAQREVFSEKTAAVFSTTSALHQARPIFIVGMLRSGTSLTEQILSAHPALGGVGERKDIALLTESLPKPYPQSAAQLTSADCLDLAQRYLDQVSPHHDPGERPVDKMMTNFLHLGFIAKLFPNATIIHTQRHPWDVCLSNYMQNFAFPPGWAQSLDGLGRYYANYQRMMDHWETALPLPIFHLSYAQLVADPEPTIRQLLEHFQVEWDPTCLSFHQNKKVVQTASNYQVRQPLHNKRVERWRRFESQLEPLRKWLGDP